MRTQTGKGGQLEGPGTAMSKNKAFGGWDLLFCIFELAETEGSLFSFVSWCLFVCVRVFRVALQGQSKVGPCPCYGCFFIREACTTLYMLLGWAYQVFLFSHGLLAAKLEMLFPVVELEDIPPATYHQNPWHRR